MRNTKMYYPKIKIYFYFFKLTFGTIFYVTKHDNSILYIHLQFKNLTFLSKIKNFFSNSPSKKTFF